MASIKLTVNSTSHTIDADPEMPLLWALRDLLGLTGTKYSCGVGLCASCTVHINGKPERSCSIPVGSVAGKSIVTIEGIAAQTQHPVLQAWIAEDVPQCGYCQPGQIMQVAALVADKSTTEKEMSEALATMLCRCGTYPRIERAIHRAMNAGGGR